MHNNNRAPNDVRAQVLIFELLLVHLDDAFGIRSFRQRLVRQRLRSIRQRAKSLRQRTTGQFANV